MGFYLICRCAMPLYCSMCHKIIGDVQLCGVHTMYLVAYCLEALKHEIDVQEHNCYQV